MLSLQSEKADERPHVGTTSTCAEIILEPEGTHIHRCEGHEASIASVACTSRQL
jgi:hypothetical protein